jgi:FtsP/CotA-like multicopper oxidase with cupredoxin domain/fibronectin type 3 domain-containing protein
MFRNKYFSLALTAILVITAIFGSTRALAQSGTGPKTAVVQNGDEPPYLKHGRITPADRQAAADRRAQGEGVSAAVVPTATDAYGNLIPDYFGVTPNYANSPLPTYAPGMVVTGGIQKFIDPLPSLPIGTPDVVTYPGADYYEIGLQDYTAQLANGIPATKLRGYVQLNSGTNLTGGCVIPGSGGTGTLCTTLDNTVAPLPIQYLGPVIVASRDRPVRIKFINQVSPGSAGDLFLPVDTTYMGAGGGPDQPMSAGSDDCSVPPPATRPAWCYSQNRATLHLHGGTTPWISDGTPHQWTTPATETVAVGGSMYPKGVSVQNVPDMDGGVEPDGTLTFYYSNQQSARLMFYHDHAYGLTRLNVYAGEAAGYLLTDQVEQDLINGTNLSGAFTTAPAAGTLPGVGTPLVIQDKTFVPDVAQLALEDPTWNTARWGGLGSLWYPHVYMPNQNPYDMTGANAMGRWDYGPWFWPPYTGLQYGEAVNPYYDPLCDTSITYCEPPFIPGTPVISGVPEGFMDTPLVNGKAYPTLTVDPVLTRFRILSAANDRFLNLQLYVASSIVGTVDITNGGAGYIDPPGVVFTNDPADTTGHGATGIANIDPASGSVTSVFLKTVGSGYTVAPTVTFTAPPAGGTLATAVANLYTAPTEVGMVPFNSTQNNLTPFPSTWYTAGNPFSLDDRDGGVPDPGTRGPAMVQIGTEGGFLPNPVKIGNTPVNFDYNRRSITVLNVLQHGLFLGPAERADVLVDFTNFAGKTLIMYNDSPAPVPAGDPRNDYYTGAPDQTDTGGVPGVLPGYGPNTRTIMQIVVTGSGGTAPVDDFSAATLTTLQTVIPQAFAMDQDTIIMPQAPYNTVYNPGVVCPGTAGCFPSDMNAYVSIQANTKTFDPIGPTGSITMNLQPKAIQELFTVDYGRMNATLGVELPNTNQTVQTTIPYGYIDPLTELLQVVDKAVPIGDPSDNGTQLWKITHNGVDTHVIHVHMFVMQLINRVGWDGAIKPGEPNEIGWKDTLRMNPLEDVIVAIRPITLVNLPFQLPNSIRPMDVTKPIGSTMGFFGVDPNGQPVTVVNDYVNYGMEYVWHCHILGHEENDMMRPMAIGVPPTAPDTVVAAIQSNGPYRIRVTWNDTSANATGFIVQRATDSAFTTPTNFNVVKAMGVLQFFVDSTATRNVSYYYRVIAVDTLGATKASGFTAAVLGYSTLTVQSVPSAAALLGTAPVAPSGLTLTLIAGPAIRLNWADNSGNETGFEVWRSINGGTFTLRTTTIANAVTFTDTPVTPGSTYAYQVRAVNATGASAFAGPVSLLVPPVPAAPTALTLLQTSATNVRVNWVDNATNETGYEVYRSLNGGTFSLVTTTTANTTSYNSAVIGGNTYAFQVRAINLSGASAYAGPLSILVKTPPAAPTGLTAAQNSATTVVLNWTDNATNETGFQLYRSVNGGAFNLRATLGANVVTYLDAVSAGNTYSYQLRAYNVAGNSAFAGPVSVTIVTVPAAPSGLTATKLTATTLSLNWTDNSTNEAGFQVYRSVNGSAYSLRATVGVNITTYTDTVTAGSTYSYQVRAYNISGFSAFAGPVALVM